MKGFSLVRHFSTTPQVYKQQRALVHLKKLQAEFQADDGRLVWEKAGLRDKILYTTTVVGCYVGGLMSIAFLYDMIKPASWNTTTC